MHITSITHTSTHAHISNSISPGSYVRILIKCSSSFACPGEKSSITIEHNRNREEDAFMPLRGGGSKYYPP